MSDDSLKNDPDVLAEEKKLKLLQLRLQRYKEQAKAISFFLQTFKAEAVSLISGLGTLVLGWYQLKKWVVQGRHELKEAYGPSAMAPRVTLGHGRGVGYGYGNGLAASHRSLTATVVEADRLPMAATMAEAKTQTAASDPANYVWLSLIVAFIWSSLVAWIKKRKRGTETEEKDGTV